MRDGYVFTEAETLKVRKVLGAMPFGAAVRRPVSQVGSLAVLIEWLEDLSATLQAGAGLRTEDARELRERREDDEAIRRFLGRVLPGGNPEPESRVPPDSREVARIGIQCLTGGELDAAVSVYAALTGQSAYRASRELGLVTE